MSHYGHGREGDRRGYGGRDQRERSPSRQRGREYGRRDGRGDRDRDRGYGGREDSTSKGSDAPARSSAPPLPSRVDVPKTGQKVPTTTLKPRSSSVRGTVLTNHFRVQSLPTVAIHEFEFRFVIPPESIRPRGKNEVSFEMKTKLFRDCAEQMQMGRFFVFDGVSTGYTSDDLLEGKQEASKLINLPGHREDRPNQLQVAMRRVGKVDISSLVEHFRSKPSDISKQLLWLNTLLRDEPSRKFIAKPQGLQFYIREAGLFQPLASTGNVLEALRGFHQSVSSHFGLLSINVDTSCTAFYAPDLPLVDTMKGIGSFRDPNNTRGVDFGRISDLMKGMILYVTHRGDIGLKKRAKVKGLFGKSAREATFEHLNRETGESKLTTVEDYFQSKYNLRLKFPYLPLIDTGIGLLPPEVCMTATGARYREVLEGKEAADFIKFATAPAHVRSKQVMESVSRLGWHNQQKVAAHGVSMEPKMLEVPAARLTLPSPTYANDQRASIQNGAWNLRDKRFIDPSGFKAWGTVYFPPPGRTAVSFQELENFMRVMYDALRQYGIHGPNGPPASMLGNAQGDICSVMGDIVQKTRDQYAVEDVLIFCFVHEGIPADFYKTVKTATEVELGVPCQILKVEKSVYGRGQAQYCANVAMKVNLKIGGVNAHVKEALFKESPTMLIGADVNHPSPSQLKSEAPPPSIFALAGSKDMYAAKYTAVAAAIPATQETVEGSEVPLAFAKMVEELAKRFAKNNGDVKPQRVVYWRDGVSESEEGRVLEGEVAVMRAKFREMGLDVLLTAVLAVKRHHTRFFPASRADGDQKLGNVFPGTVVESGDRSAFVVGHGALQGTVRPTHYKVIFDENRLGADIFHRLVLHGCYSYGRATRGVHTHAAIYYADQIAERSRARLRIVGDAAHFKDVHQKLRSSTMWWQ